MSPVEPRITSLGAIRKLGTFRSWLTFGFILVHQSNPIAVLDSGSPLRCGRNDLVSRRVYSSAVEQPCCWMCANLTFQYLASFLRWLDAEYHWACKVSVKFWLVFMILGGNSKGSRISEISVSEPLRRQYFNLCSLPDCAQTTLPGECSRIIGSLVMGFLRPFRFNISMNSSLLDGSFSGGSYITSVGGSS